MTKAEDVEMPQLQQRLLDGNKSLCFLLEFAALEKDDRDSYTETVRWFHRMPSIFTQYWLKASELTQLYQDDLKVVKLPPVLLS